MNKFDTIWNGFPICSLFYSYGQIGGPGCKPGEVYQRNFHTTEIWAPTLLEELESGLSLRTALFAAFGIGPKNGWDEYPIKVSWVDWENDSSDRTTHEVTLGGSWDLFVQIIEKRLEVVRKKLETPCGNFEEKK